MKSLDSNLWLAHTHTRTHHTQCGCYTAVAPEVDVWGLSVPGQPRVDPVSKKKSFYNPFYEVFMRLTSCLHPKGIRKCAAMIWPHQITRGYGFRSQSSPKVKVPRNIWIESTTIITNIVQLFLISHMTEGFGYPVQTRIKDAIRGLSSHTDRWHELRDSGTEIAKHF